MKVNRLKEQAPPWPYALTPTDDRRKMEYLLAVRTVSASMSCAVKAVEPVRQFEAEPPSPEVRGFFRKLKGRIWPW